ncbi:hypothetical protein M0L20_22200, partial [Spirosoma sp. RP8]
MEILFRDNAPSCSPTSGQTQWRLFSANWCPCNQTPNWQNKEIRCNGGNRQWWQHDDNECSNQGNRWGEVVEYNTCACRSSDPNWQNKEIRCNGGNRQWWQHDDNECSNQGNRWGEVVEYNTCACRSSDPNWQNKEIRCNGGNRQWWQHDDNECSNQGNRWGEVVEYNTCACRSSDPNWQNKEIRCNGGNRQWWQHDDNECSNQGNRWGEVVEYNTCACRSSDPNWQNKEIRCNGGNRQWWQHDDNECSNQGNRWGEVVEYNTCSCGAKPSLATLVKVGAADFSSAPSFQLCEGSNLVFGMDRAANTGYNVQWSGPAGQGPLNDNWFINNITQGGTYTYTVTDLSTGCASSASVTVAFKAKPSLATLVKVGAADFSSAPSFQLCEGSNLVFGMDRAANTGYNVQWSGPAGQGPLNDNWFINNITQGGTYTYTVTDLS